MLPVRRILSMVDSRPSDTHGTSVSVLLAL
jgi:hypothetical protein